MIAVCAALYMSNAVSVFWEYRLNAVCHRLPCTLDCAASSLGIWRLLVAGMKGGQTCSYYPLRVDQ